MMKQKINMEVDSSALDQEIANYEKQLRQCFANRDSIMVDLDAIDYEDRHYRRRKADLEERLYKTYDKIEEMEVSLVSAKAKKRSILQCSGQYDSGANSHTGDRCAGASG